MKTKEKVLVYAEDLEKIATLIDALARKIHRVSSCGTCHNDLAISMKKLMVRYPSRVIFDFSQAGAFSQTYTKPEVFWTEKRKLAKREREKT